MTRIPKQTAALHGICFDYLADHPGFIPILARWHFNEWAYLRPDDSVDARIARLHAACGRGNVPTVFIARSEGVLLGSAMLIAHDMDTRMESTPWLAGVVVGPDYRRRGIGSALVAKVIECVAAHGTKRLYLYTPSAEQMYLRLGWLVVERTNYLAAGVVVMSYDIQPDSNRAARGGAPSAFDIHPSAFP